MRLAICIATFRRPALLRDLLSGLSQLQFRKVSRPEIQVIVVDNDALRSAEPVCNRSGFPWDLRYLCEPSRGIARVRNRAITAADGAEFLAFIDDDEMPSPHWLDELLWAQSQFQASIVSGAVIPTFSADVPEWVRAAGFFNRRITPTGHTVELCSTNNALVRRDILKVVPGFSERFNLTGGEDTHFFLRIRNAGFRMVASEEAIVYEPISEGRANLAWILRRGYQSGNSWALCEADVKPGLLVAFSRALKGMFHMCSGVLSLTATSFSGKATTARSLRTIFLGAGMLTGVAGRRFLPYQDADRETADVPAPVSMQG